MRICSLPPFKPSSSNTTRFGWHKRQPPQGWRFELSSDHFANPETLTLKPEVIQRIAGTLIRDTLEKPGFAFIPNLHQFTNSAEAAWQFQKTLLHDVYRIAEKAWGLDTVEYRLGDVVIVDRDAQGTVGNRGGKGISSLHWDGGIDQLVSFLYQTRNLRGGLPMVGDVIQYLVDNHHTAGLRTLSDSDPRYVLRAESLLKEPHPRPSQSKTPGLLSRLARFKNPVHPLQPYHWIIDDPAFSQSAFPMVIVNNRREDGLTHTGTAVKKQDENQPAARVLRQVFIQTDLIPDQKIILVGPPPNALEKTLVPESLSHNFDDLPDQATEHHRKE